MTTAYTVRLPEPHPMQEAFIRSTAKRKVVRAGRRGGKTVGVAILACEQFVHGKRVLYTAPTVEQLETFWREAVRALSPLIDAGVYKKNETEHFIEKPGTENRLKAKTAWNADSMRGDYASVLILDEWQLCNESAWTEVGAPMLLDTDGDAIFIYTPPSLRSSGISKAHDPLHAAKMFRMAQAEQQEAVRVGRVPRWEVFHFTSHQNPYISEVALGELVQDMSRESYRREIEAEDDDISPNRLIYRAFNEVSQKIPPFEIPKHWPRYVGHDFGSANPCAVFFANDPSTGYFYAYQEYFPGVGRSTYQHVQEFKAMTEGVTVLKRAGGSHQEDEIRQGYTAQGWPIQEPKILNVNARIDRVRGMMEKNQLFVFNTCHRLLGELATYLWKTDTDGRITDEIYNKAAFHALDATAYILSDFTPERVQGQNRSSRPVNLSIAM